MFGRPVQATGTSPSPVAPTPDAPPAQLSGGRRLSPIPHWLLPWLFPLVVVPFVVVAVVAPAYVTVAVFLALLALVLWWLTRTSDGSPFYERNRNDRYLRRRD